jgi:hypothetical protein
MKKLIQLFLVISFIAINLNLYANNITISVNKNWSTINTGSGPGGQPNSSDAVTVSAGATLTVDVANASCASVQLGVADFGFGGTLTFNANSLLTVSGAVTLGVNISLFGTGSITMTSGGILKIGGSFTAPKIGTFTPGAGTIEYNGASQTVLSSAALGNIAYNNLTLSGSGSKTTTGATVNGILSMQGTATTTGTVASYGAAATLEYKGSATQTSGTEFPATWSGTGGVIINNANGVTLSASKTINNTLTMTLGNLFLGANTLTAGSIINVSPSSSKMIVLDDGTNFGTLKLKTPTNTTYTYSIGDTRGTADYTPLVFNLTSGANSSAFVSVSMKNIKNTNNTSPVIYLNRTWNLSQTSLTSSTYSITFNYVVGDISVPASESSLYFGEFNGTWTILGPTVPATHSFTKAGLTIFSDFTGGEQGLLPVELSSFSSSVNANNVKLTWITASESNNQGFEIYRRSEQTNWMKIGFVSGSGTVNTPKTYSYNDNGLSAGKYSYELKQIDFNGNFEFFVMSGITDIGTPKKFEVSQNYPNPFNPVTKIDYQLPDAGKIKLVIYDLLGREVKNLVSEVKPAGFYSAEFDATSFASGIYIYRLSFESSNNNFIITKRMSLIK